MRSRPVEKSSCARGDRVMVIDKAIPLSAASDWLQGTSELMAAVWLRKTKLWVLHKNQRTASYLDFGCDYPACFFERASVVSWLYWWSPFRQLQTKANYIAWNNLWMHLHFGVLIKCHPCLITSFVVYEILHFYETKCMCVCVSLGRHWSDDIGSKAPLKYLWNLPDSSPWQERQ